MTNQSDPTDSAFRCPHCGKFAGMEAWDTESLFPEEAPDWVRVPNVSFMRCSQCGEITIWRDGTILWPSKEVR